MSKPQVYISHTTMSSATSSIIRAIASLARSPSGLTTNVRSLCGKSRATSGPDSSSWKRSKARRTSAIPPPTPPRPGSA
eukprot:8913524-Pyramimonas_sp.AAC.1